MDSLRKSFIGKKIFILKKFKLNEKISYDLDCGIFTNKNIGGYGKGIRGDFFYSDEDLQNSLEQNNHYRILFTIETLPKLKEILLGGQLFFSDEYFKNFIRDLIVKTRNSYCSADPELERKEGVYVEIEDLFI